MRLLWGGRFKRDFKRLVKKNPQLVDPIQESIQQLTENPFHPSLNTHKLLGELSGVWSCSIDYSNRILFEFSEHPCSGEAVIFLLTLGSHDEVY